MEYMFRHSSAGALFQLVFHGKLSFSRMKSKDIENSALDTGLSTLQVAGQAGSDKRAKEKDSSYKLVQWSGDSRLCPPL
jgi:hypothetical protein